ncbi:MFS transporter [Prosthecomicrobium sp. N25]
MTVPLIVACAFFMENFDATVITTALPSIGQTFGVSAVEAGTGMTAYFVALAAFIPVSGWAADRFGVKTVFRLSMALFTLASVACGLCQSLEQFIAARIVQGAGGAMLVPVGRLAVLRAVEKAEFVRAMSWVTTPALVGSVIGPPVGGFLTTYVSWRWVFLLQVPVGLLGIILVTRYFAPDRGRDRRPLDWVGFLSIGPGIALLVAALEIAARGETGAALPLALLGAGAAVLTVAVLHASRHPAPLIDPSLLRIDTFARSVGSGNLFIVAAAAVPFLMPLMLQVGFGFSAFASGLMTFTGAAGALAMKAASPAILRRYGFRTVLVGNGLLVAVATILCALFTQATPAAAIAAVLLAFGFARSLQFVALNTIAYANVPPERMSAATTFAGMTRQVGNAAGVAGSALILQALVGPGSATVTASDLSAALFAVGGVAGCSALLFLRLDPAAGADVSGHGRKPPPKT